MSEELKQPEQDTRLVLICEGGAHMLEYFHKNKVYPTTIVLDAQKFKEMSPYLTSKDDILLVVKGFTDFTLSDIYELLNSLEDSRSKLHDVTVMSNIELGKINTPYYLYEGDLFFGKIKEVKDGKKTDVLTEEELKAIEEAKVKGKKKNKKVAEVEKTPQKPVNNAVIRRYKKYSRRDTKFTIYATPVKEVITNTPQDEIAKKIVNVDLYKNK